MSFAFMPVYTGDYLRDTQHLTPMRHGVYFKFLMFCWDQKGPVPLDEQEAAGIANCRSADEIEAMRYILNRYFIRMTDGWYNQRMQTEIERAENISKSRSKAGKKGYANRAKTLASKRSPTSAKQLLDTCSASASTPTPTPTPIKASVSSCEDTAADTPELFPTEPKVATEKQELWSAGKSLLLQAGMPAPQCGSFIGRLVKEYGEIAAVSAVRSAILERPADPASFLVACCRTASGDRATEKSTRRARADSVMSMLTGRRHHPQIKDITDEYSPPAIGR